MEEEHIVKGFKIRKKERKQNKQYVFIFLFRTHKGDLINEHH